MKTRLSEESIALTAFLESLFREPAPEAPEGPVDEVPADEVPVDEVPVDEIPVDETAAPAPEPGPDPPAPGLPPWAGERFQVLYADVGPLELALPLTSLAGVVAWPERMNTLPGQAPWVLGVTEHLGRKIKVAHTATVARPAGSPVVDVDYSRIVVTAGGGWGLACRGVSAVATLTRDQVRWRVQARQRPWLAGTVIERMTALADLDRLSAWLEEGGPGG